MTFPPWAFEACLLETLNFNPLKFHPWFERCGVYAAVLLSRDKRTT
jgi:hypothetical protein